MASRSVRHGLGCIGCAIAHFENVGQSAKAHPNSRGDGR